VDAKRSFHDRLVLAELPDRKTRGGAECDHRRRCRKRSDPAARQQADEESEDCTPGQREHRREPRVVDVGCRDVGQRNHSPDALTATGRGTAALRAPLGSFARTAAVTGCVLATLSRTLASERWRTSCGYTASARITATAGISTAPSARVISRDS